MKNIDDYLDDIQDDKYAYTETMLEYVDADKVEGLIKAMCRAMELKNVDDMKVYGMCLANSINSAMTERAETMQARSKSPLFETFDEIMGGFANLGIRKDAA